MQCGLAFKELRQGSDFRDVVERPRLCRAGVLLLPLLLLLQRRHHLPVLAEQYPALELYVVGDYEVLEARAALNLPRLRAALILSHLHDQALDALHESRIDGGEAR